MAGIDSTASQSRIVREILLPCGHGAEPAVDPRFARFLFHAGPRPIDRWGLFAGEVIPAGRVVMGYTGERI